MFTPEYLGAFPDYIVELFEEYDSFVISDFARRLGKAGRITDTASWQLLRAQEVGLAVDTLENETKRLLKLTDHELKVMFKEAGLEYVRSDQERLQIKIRQGEELERYITAAYRQTKGDLKNMVRTTATGLKVAGKTVPVKNAYYQALDLAQMQVSTGVLDYETACRQAIQRISKQGLSTLTNDAVSYNSGYSWSVRAAVRTCVLTGTNQMAMQLNDMIADDLGLDLVEVTAHAGARPSHAEWQGQVYSRSGRSRKYPNLYDVTGLGTGAGLCGYNCRHNYYAYLDGSPRAYSAAYMRSLREADAHQIPYGDKLYNAYEASQRQRALERQIIAKKRELIGYDALRDTDAYETASVALRSMREEYSDFSDTMGLRSKFERAQQDGYDRRLAGKSNYAAREHYVEWSKSIGVDTPKTLAEYYSMKYNRPNEYELLQRYTKSVNKGMISSNASFSNYVELHNQIENEVVGMTTTNGIKITGQTAHFMERILGTASDPTHKNKSRSGVSIEDIKDALTNGRQRPVRKDKSGVSQRFIGEKCDVSVNPVTGVLIQCNPS